MEKARAHVALIQKHEKAPIEVQEIRQGKEPAEFWAEWGLSAPPEPGCKVAPECDFWFADIEAAEKARPKDRPAVYTMGKSKAGTNEKDEEELAKMREMKPRLYTYPKGGEFSTVFDFEDLNENSLICLCDRGKHKLYVWKGIDFEGPEAVIITEPNVGRM